MLKVLSFWKIILWSLFMLFVFLLPADNISIAPPVPHISELVHIFSFLLFTGLFIIENVRRKELCRPTPRIYFTVLLLGILFGSVIEILQWASGLGRNAEFLDLLLDIAGCLLAILIMVAFYWYRSKIPVKD